jgi:hypothetical protein
MRILKKAVGHFDTINTFSVNVGRRYAGFECSLRQGYRTKDDGIYWIMQHSTVLANSYSTDETKQRERLKSETPLQNGEVVLIEGEHYIIRVKGNYSDCAILEKI